MRRLFVRSLAVVFAAAVLSVYAPLASAQPAGFDFLQTTIQKERIAILPPPGGPQAGYDLLQTPGGASIGVPGVSPSTVSLQGVPICACTGQTDTIMQRSAAGAGGHANLTVVALFLKNSAPVTRSGSAVDVYITVNDSGGVIGQSILPQPDGLAPSTGSLTIRADGTFDSSFTVNADIIIVAAGADVRNPATHLAHMPAAPVNLSANNNVWTAVPPAGYPPECYFPANGFYPGGPVPETAPTGPHQHPVVPSGPPVGGNGARCISFNPATTSAQLISGRWKVVDSGHPLFDFDSRQSDALKTVQIIQHYHMTETCTVGANLPGEQSPPFQYELVGSSAPSGSMAGEDCIGFNLATVTDQNISGRWTITDGPQWMFNFGPQQVAAGQGVTIIKSYAFNQSCFVGRPDTGGRYVFVYMKAGVPLILPKFPNKEIEFRKLPPINPGDPVERQPIKEPIIKR
jgi:hypothetical protein